MGSLKILTDFRFGILSGCVLTSLISGAKFAFCAELKSHDQINVANISGVNLRSLEDEIVTASDMELDHLELRVARLLQENPNNVYANYLMSTLLLRMFTLDPGSYSLIKQSTELAAQTYELDRYGDLGVAALANILETSGDFERGLALLNDVTRRGQSLGWRSGLVKAKILSNGPNPHLALKQLEEIISMPGASRALISPTLVSVILESYEGEDQIRVLRQWRERCSSLSFELALAAAYAVNDRLDDASSIYESILAHDYRNIEALINDGILSLKKQKTELAIKRFRSAVEFSRLPSEKTTAQTHLSLALIALKRDPENARKAAYDAIRSASDTEGVLVGILAAYRRHASIQTTLAFLDGLEVSVPGLHLGYAVKAELLSEKFGRHYDAMRAFTNAITLEPGRSEYYNGRGLTWMGIGQLETALADFESATTTNPDDASARYNVACALARLGRKQDAITSLSKAFELDERLIVHAKTDQDLNALRQEPAFKSLLNSDQSESILAH